MGEMFAAMAGFAMLALVLVILIYIAISSFLNKFHKLVYGKGTILVWLPFTQVYMLGKLAVNKTVGWIMVIASIMTTKFTTTVNGIETESQLLSEPFSSMVSIAQLILLVYAIIKYNRLKD